MSITPKGYERFDLKAPWQQDLLQQLLGAYKGQLGAEGMDRFAAPFERKFREETVPGLAEKFAGLGAGSQSSSAFQQALGGAGAKLSEDLAQLGAQREKSALGGLERLFGAQTEGLVKKAPSFWENLLGQLAGGVGSSLGGMLPGGIGSLAKILSALFSGNPPQGSFSDISSGQTFYPR